MDPVYNPWAAPVYPNQNDNAMQPETYVNPLANHFFSGLVNAIGRAMLAPGQAYNSTQPITSDQMIAPAMDIAGLTTLGAGAVPQEANTLNMGIKAYHGSPHDFNAFDLSKIGTGEGAQAYGHGLYFAESPGVAQSYRDQLKSQAFNFDGKTVPRDQAINLLADRVRQAMPEAKQPSSAAEMVANWTQNGMTPDQIEARIKSGAWPDAMKGEIRAAAKIVQDSIQPNPGRMYEVNINADPEHFLDWDKPLNQQHPKVQDVLGSSNSTAADVLGRAYRNEMHAGDLIGKDRANPAELTQGLAERGIPGIKYLDQGSRNAGEGSRNYVVFDDKLIDILRKYGLAGFMAPPIFAAATGEQKQ